MSDIKINKDMLISDILRLDIRLAPVFMNMGMHCLGCPAAQFESIEEACTVHGQDVNFIVNTLQTNYERFQEIDAKKAEDNED